ncbi:DUF2332 domain-containing protein [Nocardia sp. NPDC052566]|uniref:DUF2332 domain-containing protein n=1 Tax=Nocardia sp. NPDC052566 TaxID=3364330 RepID=UPI0037CC78DB
MDTAHRYRRFAELETRDYSPLYEQWCHGIADAPELLALIDQLPEAKRQPNLILGAARYLGVPLGPFPEFRDWLSAKWPEVSEIAMTHRTQTNEAGRAATLLPALAMNSGAPVALIEIGASAGLCLYPDRYSYRYDSAAIDPDGGPSPVVLTCTTSGHPPIPETLPQVMYRAGVDLDPLDVTDADDMRWLECLVWPEQQDRLERLRGAVAIARQDPPHLVAGDLNDTIADLVHAAPRDAHVIVFGSAVLLYLDPEARIRFLDTMRALRCTWITNEGNEIIPFDRPVPPNAAIESRRQFILARNGIPLAYTGPHGQTLDWFGTGD